MINWQYFPKNKKPTDVLINTIDVFKNNNKIINSIDNDFHSNEVLDFLRNDLELLEYKVEKSKRKEDKISVPVLFGANGVVEKYFDTDGYNEKEKIVMEVEAGRAVINYQFLKDFFQALVMVDVDYLIIAVRNNYRNKNDFAQVTNFFETLYSSSRLTLPLKGILIIGY